MSDLKLNPEAPAFSYTRDDLFNVIVKIIAHPHKTITKHDKVRAMAIFATFSDYLDNFTECHEDNGCYIHTSDSTDFEHYVLALLKKGPMDFYEIDVDELLK